MFHLPNSATAVAVCFVLAAIGTARANPLPAAESVGIAAEIPTAADMIIGTVPPTSWLGGGVGVQGAGSTSIGGGNPAPAAVALKFDPSAVVATLDAAYGAGGWIAVNPRVLWQVTFYDNNPRFGSGVGTFDIFWIANDTWAQGSNDPVFASTPSALTAWAGSAALLHSASYAWTGAPVSPTGADWKTAKSGPNAPDLAYPLAASQPFLADIESGGPVSLYLMPTSAGLGMTIFVAETGVYPTLTFDIVAAPEPSG